MSVELLALAFNLTLPHMVCLILTPRPHVVEHLLHSPLTLETLFLKRNMEPDKSNNSPKVVSGELTGMGVAIIHFLRSPLAILTSPLFGRIRAGSESATDTTTAINDLAFVVGVMTRRFNVAPGRVIIKGRVVKK